VGSRDLFAVGGGSLDELVRDADVKIAGPAGEDVDPEMVLAIGHGGIVAGWRCKKQVPGGDDRKKSKGKGKGNSNGKGKGKGEG
jgi:hypothetical protein